MKWSEQVWQLAGPIYRSILSHPFIIELANGTLARERFLFYLNQDAIYIDNYCRVLAHIASRLDCKEHVADFLRFATDGIAVEKALHESYLGLIDPDVDPTPTCLLYNCFETAQAMAPVEVEAAAILPCFWIYHQLRKNILESTLPDNPYYRWILTYGDEAFAESTRRAIEICDELAEAGSEEIRASMTDAFMTAARMEWMFWNSAYNLEKWEI